MCASSITLSLKCMCLIHYVPAWGWSGRWPCQRCRRRWRRSWCGVWWGRGARCCGWAWRRLGLCRGLQGLDSLMSYSSALILMFVLLVILSLSLSLSVLFLGFCVEREWGGVWGLNRASLEREKRKGKGNGEFSFFNFQLSTLGEPGTYISIKVYAGASFFMDLLYHTPYINSIWLIFFNFVNK